MVLNPLRKTLEKKNELKDGQANVSAEKWLSGTQVKGEHLLYFTPVCGLTLRIPGSFWLFFASVTFLFTVVSLLSAAPL